MIGRYRIVRGRRPPGEPLPDGVRQDTRKHTRHVLRPEAEDVRRFLADPTPASWEVFAAAYRATLARRFEQERAAFEELAALARAGDLWLGCNCPTKSQPDMRRCHTVLALEFLARAFPDLEVRFPA